MSTALCTPLNAVGVVITDRLLITRIKESREAVHILELHRREPGEDFTVKILHVETHDAAIVSLRDQLIDYCTRCKIGQP